MFLTSECATRWRRLRRSLFEVALENSGEAVLKASVKFVCEGKTARRELTFGKGASVFFFDQKGSSYNTPPNRVIGDCLIKDDSGQQLRLLDVQGRIKAVPRKLPVYDMK